MRQHYLFAVLGFSAVLALGVSIVGCDEANPTAPDNTVLFITANPTQIALNGSSQITVTGFKPDGNPLNPGTQIIFEATFGVVNPSIVGADGTGRAMTTFTSDGTLPSGGMGPATATVTASLVTSGSSGGGSGGGTGGMGGGSGSGTGVGSVTVNIQIGETKPTLTVTVTPSTVSLDETADVLVRARRADGSNFGAGGRVQLRTTLGQLDETNLVTDSNGEAQTVFRSGDQTGTATITGTIESSDEVTADVVIENQKPVLVMSANPDDIAVGQTSTITILARDNNDFPLGAGEEIQLLASLGSIPDSVKTNANGRAEVTYESGDLAGTATIQAVLRNSDTTSVQVNIRDAVREFLFTANPLVIDRPVQDATATIRLTGTVRNAQGQPLNNILVTFTSPDVGGTFQTTSGSSSNGTAQTGGQGVAELDLVVNSSGVGNRASFEVQATVVSEGDTFVRTVSITVRN